MEKKVFFESYELKLEGLLNKGESDKGIIITHPHPLYGGDMHNYVVESIKKVYRKKNYTTFCFNFRGVGESQGNYDNDQGEQEDLRSALSFIASTGINQVELAGYSYGAWINSLVACKDASIKNIVLLSPPVAFIDFKPVTSIPGSSTSIITWPTTTYPSGGSTACTPTGMTGRRYPRTVPR